MPRMSSVDSRLVAVGMLALIGITGVCALLEVGGVVRLAATVAFFLVVPGWAVVALARPRAALGATALAVSVAISVALELLVANTMLLTGGWHPTQAFYVFAVASAALIVVHLVREA